jgi:hypothetical protein
MKKTIAILLVLVIAMAGVFAANPVNNANAQIILNTTVSGINYIAITSTGLSSDTTTMAGFLTHTGTPLAEKAITTTSSTIGHLNLLTNARTGIDVFMKSTQLGSSTTGNNAKIHLSVTCANDTFSTLAIPETNNGFVKILSTTETAAASGLFMHSYEITGNAEQNSFDAAPVDTYTAYLTFAFQTT